MSRFSIESKFIETHAVKDFQELVAKLRAGDAEGKLGIVHGAAGRGKTRTAAWYFAHHPECVFVRMQTAWKRSPGAFLSALCRELRTSPPFSLEARTHLIVQALAERNAVVLVDEIGKMHGDFLEICRDLSDLAQVPFVLLDEGAVIDQAQRNLRLWSRTTEIMEFRPLEPADVILWVRMSTGEVLTGEVAAYLHQACLGDFRLVKRAVYTMINMANARKLNQLDADLAKRAIEANLKGRSK